MEEIVLAKGFFDGLKPEPRLTVSQWADKYRYLAPTSSAEPGQYRTERAPYLKEIMDKLSASDPCQEVVFIKGAQVGATESGFNWLGYIIDVAPAPTLMVQPTDSMSKRNSKMRLDPMIEATPRLREKIKPSRSRDSGNTTLQKDFPGGTVVMTGANSAVGLRSMPVRFLMLDEVDGYPMDLDGEGSPIDLARARTRTFARRKIFIVSTPTTKGQSVVEAEFEETDQRRYHVPCPHCKHMQHLKWENLKWERGEPETAMYFCEECGSGIEERWKPWMLKEKAFGGLAEWIPTNDKHANPLKVGFHINSLYSPLGWYSWAEAARDWEKAEGDVNKQKAFVNTVLGETWAEKGDAPPWENLYNRREQYKINVPPADVVFLTAGVDVQKDRLELEIVGWCRNKRSYSVDFRVLLGDTSASGVWDELAKVVSESWTREDGTILPLRLMAVDTGYNTTHVYNFCRRFDVTRVIPVKGSESQQMLIAPPRQVDVTQSGKKIGRVKVWHVGVGMAKSELYGFLRQEKNEEGAAPFGYCHFPQYDTHYFKGLTAEQLEMKVNNRGYRVYQWVKKYDRNEPLDCRVYARAAASVVGIDRHEGNEAFWQTFQYQKVVDRDIAAQSSKKPVRRNRGDFW
jgi:phage terminase large subunit GpA-like protein